MKPRDLDAHVPYEAGRGIEEVARELGRDPSEFVKLASNENALGPSPAAVEAIRDCADTVSSYPKAAHADLVAAIADRWAVADEQVWLGNGGDGVIDYLFRATLEPGDEVLVPAPGFTYYSMSARFHHGEVSEYPIRKADDFVQDPEAVLDAYDGERVVYLTSPHNPTGSTVSLADVERIATGTDDETLVVVDEAYGEFADTASAVALIEGNDSRAAADEPPGVEPRDDVAVLRTFSKAYGLAGLRLGYGIVPASWADAYARVNTPFAAGELSCRAGLAAIGDDQHVERTVDVVRASREFVRERADAPSWPSDGNFVLLEVGDATAVTTEMQARGIIVRDCSSFGLDECIRITCGTETETERAVETLNAVLADLGLDDGDGDGGEPGEELEVNDP